MEILKEKFRYNEISARKLHINGVILALKLSYFKIKVFHYSFENFNDHFPFK